MRFRRYLSQLSSISATPESGITRLLYSYTWKEAQEALHTICLRENITPSFDSVGNLFGRITGSKIPGEIILTGSHIDSVINGGRFDGQFGVVASLIAMAELLETYGAPKKTLEFVSFAEEESSRFAYGFWGSKNMLGIADSADVIALKDVDGISFPDAMTDAGFSFADYRPSKKEGVSTFVEVHIEQGNILSSQQKQVGIVTSIVGLVCYTITMKGLANHAGTTPMDLRTDALLGFSTFHLQATELARSFGAPLVLTCGELHVFPNSSNVIPGSVSFSIDCRHTDQLVLHQFTTALMQLLEKIALEQSLEVVTDCWLDIPPVPMDDTLIEKLDSICQTKKLTYQKMSSGAGHDSQIIGEHIPTVMIFTPSVDGISHSPQEFTEEKDLLTAISVLKDLLYELAY